MNKLDTLAFVMPIRSTGKSYELPLLKRVINSILNQSDQNWLLAVVDDDSPCRDSRTFLEECIKQYPEKIVLQVMSEQHGPGYCRNVAIEQIASRGIPVVMFNDSDDISHTYRVAVTREIFAQSRLPTVLYSTFIPVDETGSVLGIHQLTPSLIEILDAHKHDPPQGDETWKKIGTETGYVNLNSSTAVSTELAIKYPFPNEVISEDSHTWMRYSAGGGRFVYDERIPVCYRVTTDQFGSASRNRHGERFYTEKARVDEDGFRQSIQLALQRRTIEPCQGKELLIKFYVRLAETLIKEKVDDVAASIISKALRLSPDIAETVVRRNDVVAEHMKGSYHAV